MIIVFLWLLLLLFCFFADAAGGLLKLENPSVPRFSVEAFNITLLDHCSNTTCARSGEVSTISKNLSEAVKIENDIVVAFAQKEEQLSGARVAHGNFRLFTSAKVLLINEPDYEAMGFNAIEIHLDTGASKLGQVQLFIASYTSVEEVKALRTHLEEKRVDHLMQLIVTFNPRQEGPMDSYGRYLVVQPYMYYEAAKSFWQDLFIYYRPAKLCVIKTAESTDKNTSPYVMEIEQWITTTTTTTAPGVGQTGDTLANKYFLFTENAPMMALREDFPLPLSSRATFDLDMYICAQELGLHPAPSPAPAPLPSPSPAPSPSPSPIVDPSAYHHSASVKYAVMIMALIAIVAILVAFFRPRDQEAHYNTYDTVAWDED